MKNLESKLNFLIKKKNQWFETIKRYIKINHVDSLWIGISIFTLFYIGILHTKRKMDYHTSLTNTYDILLQDGNKLPYLALNFKNSWKEIVWVFYEAISVGIYHFSLGSNLTNFIKFRNVLLEFRITRKKIFITINLPIKHLGLKKTFKFLKEALKNLHVKYIDLCLISMNHYKNVFLNSQEKILFRETWRALERIKMEGLIKNIGLENINKMNIMEIIGYAETFPCVCLLKFIPNLIQAKFLKFCRHQNIKIILNDPFRVKELVNTKDLKDLKLLISPKYALIKYHHIQRICMQINVTSKMNLHILIRNVFSILKTGKIEILKKSIYFEIKRLQLAPRPSLILWEWF